MRFNVLAEHQLPQRLRCVKNTFDGDVYSREKVSFLMKLASCCSEQMDVPESIDVGMNVKP